MKHILPLIIMFLSVYNSTAQTLRTEGKLIKNDQGEKVILRGIGTGNWVLMEGYMMKTAGVTGTQHEFRQKLIDTIGESATDDFFEKWWHNHMTKADVDSMAQWGFNSLRLAMHYNQFTPPIERESASNLSKHEYTWYESGFERVDQVLSWCKANNMYLILDLHAAPGGQGRNADISDYDPNKLSLWEDVNNRHKMVALWKKLADRYKNEAWIGGYDLLNETNWSELKNDNNQMLWSLLEECTDAIRSTGDNHIVFLEGNDWANNYDGLPETLWDDNIAISFHKYWNNVDANSLDWIIEKSDKYDVPLWLGESGENSNVWYTHLIKLCESKDIGWSWWPVKKNGINNVMYVEEPKAYKRLVDGWRTESTTDDLTGSEAVDALNQWAENHKIENVRIMYDVIDAMIRQPHTDDGKAYKKHAVGDKTWFADFDMGKNGYTYWDKDTANLSQVTDYTDWNTGWTYRNDAVDIQPCADKSDDGSLVGAAYNVGWTADKEWIQYTVNNPSIEAFNLHIRHAGNASLIKIMANGVDITSTLTLPSTANYDTWTTTTFKDIVLPKGEVKVVFYFIQGGANLNYFEFTDGKPINTVDFHVLSAKTNSVGGKIFVTVNKSINSTSVLNPIDFTLSDDTGKFIGIQDVEISKDNDRLLEISCSDFTYFNQLTLSYRGDNITSQAQPLASFTSLDIENLLPRQFRVPGKIEAEDFVFNNGFAFENTSDVDGSKNSSYAKEGYYLDYLIAVENTSYYDLDMRIASTQSAPKISMWLSKDNGVTFDLIKTFTLRSTGSWTTWQTQKAIKSILLHKGDYRLRLKVEQQEHNLNWFELKQVGETISDSPDEIFSSANFNLSYQSPTCYQLNNGSITILSKASPMEVTLNSRDTYHVSQNIPYQIEGLSAGEYDILTSTIHPYSSQHKVILEEPASLYATARVDGKSVSFNIEGGEAPYTVILNGQEQITQKGTLTVNNLVSGSYTAKVSDSNLCSEDSDITFSIASVNIYPNPVTSGTLYINIPYESDAKSYQTEVYSTDGKLIYQRIHNTYNNLISLDLQPLAKGPYILKVSHQEEVETFNIIVQ
ncbi:cellulase family glycosylhydrolase [Prolixibacteraceae bacterium]|nr:cellulase family glycosylhydrolase [Prolixibacteraceae bacterium]